MIIIFNSYYIIFIKFTIRYLKDNTVIIHCLNSMFCSFWNNYIFFFLNLKYLTIQLYLSSALHYFPKFPSLFMILKTEPRIRFNIN